MKTVRTVADLRAALAGAEAPVGLVPTMGALHEGHLSLLRAAREECATVVMSLFVNPTQFAAGEDLGAYPRDEHRDAAMAAGEGVDVLFAPSEAEMFPRGFATTVEVSGITEVLEGGRGSRGPGHFRGVATVVTKLLNMAGPDVAYFGQKDAQQALVIRRLVRDLDLPVRIEVRPTVREPDGLAMSSRNVYLGPEDRLRASAISRALGAAEREAAEGERDAATLVATARAELDRAGIEADYLELRHTDDLTPAERLDGPALLAVAARVGPARLIDNVVLEPAAPPPAEALLTTGPGHTSRDLRDGS